MKRLAIIGSGDLGELIAYHAINDRHYEVIGFFDDYEELGSEKHGLPILGGTNTIQSAFEQKRYDCLMIGVGYKHMQFRKSLFDTFFSIIPFGSIVHSSDYVDSSVKIGEGVFILPGCVLDKNVELKDNVLLNTSVSIAHDSIIESHCFLSPRVAIAGFSTIEECCVLGINSTIIDNVTIAANTQIGGGAVVIKNITIPGLYVGNPHRFVR